MLPATRDDRPMALVTTSWDDGHPYDLRLASLLATYQIAGTFYVPSSYSKRPLMEDSQLRDLIGMNMEIGSHTDTHPVLTKLPPHEIWRELRESRERLEQRLGRAVPSFCYPKGKFNRAARKLIAPAGYRLARTTVAFRTELDFDPARMPVSCQCAPQSRAIRLRHALREGNLRGLRNWSRWFGLESEFASLARLMFDRVLRQGGVFHLWGHSWELEEGGLWSACEDVLRYIARRPGVAYVTNGGVMEARAEPRK
jgi:peptidoglycan/xylan/chitin deacetylase (PgdA/CDA1 family)